MKTHASLIIFTVFVVALLAGCGEGTKSVSWYKEHKAELKAKLE
jgi:hypothetical protein